MRFPIQQPSWGLLAKHVSNSINTQSFLLQRLPHLLLYFLGFSLLGPPRPFSSTHIQIPGVWLLRLRYSLCVFSFPNRKRFIFFRWSDAMLLEINVVRSGFVSVFSTFLLYEDRLRLWCLILFSIILCLRVQACLIFGSYNFFHEIIQALLLFRFIRVLVLIFTAGLVFDELNFWACACLQVVHIWGDVIWRPICWPYSL